jgi:3-hydroxyisobutyrate dehydrogenase-like beta-hydroxyacid dehydrogenase
MTSFGCTVYTNLDERSAASRKRAEEAGMVDVPIPELVQKSEWILSILPPRDAVSFAERIIGGAGHGKRPTFVDCNAVNPETVKRIAGLFAGTGFGFVDAGIFGQPPKDGYDPTFYASAEDERILDEFAVLGKYGLRVSTLKGEGAGIGDASALKMSYSVSGSQPKRTMCCSRFDRE